MSKIEDGGPAFPHDKVHHNTQVGMSLRDYLAGQALQGLVLGITVSPDTAQMVQGTAQDKGISPSVQMARICYSYADAMLHERLRTLPPIT